jgi:hypothetical protein
MEMQLIGVLEYMDNTGHSEIHWDSTKQVEVDAARAQFEFLKNNKYIAFRLKSDGSPGERIYEFDPKAERILLQPQFAGG